MRKGEKLVTWLSLKFPVLDSIEVPARDSRLIKIIYFMSDEQFDKIITTETTTTDGDN